VRIEHEFFGDDAFTEMARKGHRRADRFAVEDRVRQLSEQLMPLSDRANRMMIRNLKAIKELRQGQVPAIAIGRAEQVTVTNRPSRRLRPVKTELPQALSDRAVRIAERAPTPSRLGLTLRATPSLRPRHLNLGQAKSLQWGNIPSDVGANVSGRLCDRRHAGAHTHATQGRHRQAPGTSELTIRTKFTRAINRRC
jgi:hypothetical protein